MGVELTEDIDWDSALTLDGDAIWWSYSAVLSKIRVDGSNEEVFGQVTSNHFALDPTSIYTAAFDGVRQYDRSGNPGAWLVQNDASGMHWPDQIVVAGGGVVFTHANQGGLFEPGATPNDPPVLVQGTDVGLAVGAIATDTTSLDWSTYNGQVLGLYAVPLGGGTATKIADGQTDTCATGEGYVVYTPAVTGLYSYRLPGGPAVKITGGGVSRGAAISQGYVYWQAVEDASIWKAPLAGGEPQIVAASCSRSASWLVVDSDSVYWVGCADAADANGDPLPALRRAPK